MIGKPSSSKPLRNKRTTTPIASTSVTSQKQEPNTYGANESSKTADRGLASENKSSSKNIFKPEREIMKGLKDKEQIIRSQTINARSPQKANTHISTSPPHNDTNTNNIRKQKPDSNSRSFLNPPFATDSRDTNKVNSNSRLTSPSFSTSFNNSGKINSVSKPIIDTNKFPRTSVLEDKTATASKYSNEHNRLSPNQANGYDRLPTNISQLTIDKSPQSTVNPVLNTLSSGRQTRTPADPLAEKSTSQYNTNFKSNTISDNTKIQNVQKPTRGLKNLGNTCFMNCILQCLSHTIPLKQFFVSCEYQKYLAGRKGDLSYAFRCVMTELWVSNKDSYPPYDLKRQVGIVAPRFSGYSQHDAQEFMRFLLNEIHDEINMADLKKRQAPKDNESLEGARERYLTWENSKISELFSGMLRSEVCCSVCKRKSIVYDPFMDLALPILKIKPTSRSYNSYSIGYDTTTDSAVKLNACLQMFTHEETLDDEERPYCNNCKKMTKSTKQLGIVELPKFLVIQLKRFSGYSIRSKLSTPVEFEESWEIQDYFNITHSYSLYGIACHCGGIYGGHYTAYCKYDKQWRCFNDNYSMSNTWDQVKRQEAYILFYEKNNN